eukprot:767956-Hanusia_phi.AAC.3
MVMSAPNCEPSTPPCSMLRELRSQTALAHQVVDGHDERVHGGLHALRTEPTGKHNDGHSRDPPHDSLHSALSQAEPLVGNVPLPYVMMMTRMMLRMC